MTLHNDTESFRELISLTSQELKIEEIYIEKDYFVVLALKSLSNSKYRKNGIFKGGTSLSKAYKVLHRFSEDIDLAIVNNEATQVGGRSLLKQVEKALTSNKVFTENLTHHRVRKDKWLRQSVHSYPQQSPKVNYGQITQYLYIDTSRISPSIPFEEREVSSYIHDFLIVTNQQLVINEFELEPILVQTMSMERTFVEKFGLLIKYSFSSLHNQKPIDRLKSGIRHIYDLHLLLQQDRIQRFLHGKSKVLVFDFNAFLAEVLQQDSSGNQNIIGYSDFMNSNFSDSLLLADIELIWNSLKPTYEGTFSRMLYQNFTHPTSSQIIESLHILKAKAKTFDTWKHDNRITF